MEAKVAKRPPCHYKILILIILPSLLFLVCHGRTNDYETPAALPLAVDDCNGIFLSYTLISRKKEYPHIKNASAQAWAFKSIATIVNAGDEELKDWEMFVGFQQRELLVSATGAVIVDGGDFPADVGNGTTFAGEPLADLKTSIETAGDETQFSVQIRMIGSQFGVPPPGVPMPKDIKLVNDGYKCPKPTMKGRSSMQVCCEKDPKLKKKQAKKIKYSPRRYGDLSLTYDVVQAYRDNYLALVTMDNNNPLGRLDHWNLTWEWMNGEFIYSMKGAYTRTRNQGECIYGRAGKYYQDFDFSNAMSCDRKPIISDLPLDRQNDTQIGRIPYCCRNGSLLPSWMDESKARSKFQLQVYKLPPDLNRTALEPPQKWQIKGVLNPEYKCGPPIRVEATEFPDPGGLHSVTTAIATWQVVCNITKPKEGQTRCCVSFSAFYNNSVIPCNTCACGCDDDTMCSQKANALLLPPEALLVPFVNRTAKAVAWAKINHFKVPNPRPCPDNCPVSINWHLNSNYKTGWTARITLFNWENDPFEDWFAAFEVDKAYPGYENVYSFNGTRLDSLNKTIFVQGLPGLNYLMGETNGTRIGDPRLPGKQQSVISFTKKHTSGISVAGGDGFPKRVFFNGEECALPPHIPTNNAGHKEYINKSFAVVFIAAITLVLLN